MGTAYDIAGKKFNSFTVLERAPNRNTRQSWWLCQCDCGTIKEVRGLPLTTGIIKHCGCVARTAHNFKGIGELSGKYWGHIQRHARTRDIEFNVSKEDAWDKFRTQEGKCALSGLPIVLSKNYSGRSGQTASLDRIDSKKHYYKENIQWVHVDVNKMKNNLPEDRLFELCEMIVKTRTVFDDIR